MSSLTLEQIINERISVRAFDSDQEVSEQTLQTIIEMAGRAPSWKNAQAYKIIAVTGEPKEKLSQALVQAVQNGQEENPDFDYEKGHPPHIKKRMFDLGMSLFSHMGIDRKDKEARDQFGLQNYKSFGAPVMLFCYIPDKLREWSILDLGIFLGYLSLAAVDQGLGTCLQATLAAYPDIVKKYTGVDENYKLMVGLSLGYPEQSAQVNGFKSGRVPVSEILEIKK